MDKSIPLHYQPDYSVLPGHVLEDVLESCNMSQHELAERSGLSTEEVAAIIDGRSTVTSENAHKLELALGMPAQLWLNLEIQYQERSARVKTG